MHSKVGLESHMVDLSVEAHKKNSSCVTTTTLDGLKVPNALELHVRFAEHRHTSSVPLLVSDGLSSRMRCWVHAHFVTGFDR